jgi:thiol-disulfide isomerase/thioredoxin
MIALGTKAPFFELPNPSKSNEIQSLDDLKGEKGTLVIFMCNHCPFVLHVIDKLNELYEDYNERGIEFIAINSNDVEKYPADSPEKMIEFQIERKFDFLIYMTKARRLQKLMMQLVHQISFSLMKNWILSTEDRWMIQDLEIIKM